MPLINATYNPVERRWLAEYLGRLAPLAAIQFEKRLTISDVAAQRRMGGGVKPRAGSRIVAKLDAWVTLPDGIQLWEAKRRAPVAGVVQLAGYQLILPNTWEGQNEAFLPLSYHVLVEHFQSRAELMAQQYGIHYHVYLPDWLKSIEVAAMAKGEERRLAYEQKISQPSTLTPL
jgi:hypothetical protein